MQAMSERVVKAEPDDPGAVGRGECPRAAQGKSKRGSGECGLVNEGDDPGAWHRGVTQENQGDVTICTVNPAYLSFGKTCGQSLLEAVQFLINSRLNGDGDKQALVGQLGPGHTDVSRRVEVRQSGSVDDPSPRPVPCCG